jgi:hypothetical protein
VHALTDATRGAGLLQFYDDHATVRRAIVEALSLDPRTLHSKKKHLSAYSILIYGFMFDRLDVIYWMKEPTHVEVRGPGVNRARKCKAFVGGAGGAGAAVCVLVAGAEACFPAH